MRGRLKQFVWGSRRRKVSAVVLSALTLSGTAVAAFFIFTGADGSGSGSYAAAQTASAITVNGTSQPQLQGPGDSQPMSLAITNNDPGAAHQLNSLSGVFTSNPAVCASHLSLDFALGSGGVGTNYLAGATNIPETVGIKTSLSTPVVCASGTWSVAFSGTTTP